MTLVLLFHLVFNPNSGTICKKIATPSRKAEPISIFHSESLDLLF